MIALFLLTGYVALHAENTEGSKAIFYVGWYDVGQSALEGLKGVYRVDRGFLNSKEINTVYYDPTVITIEEMEKALKEAGTYRGTVKSEE